MRRDDTRIEVKRTVCLVSGIAFIVGSIINNIINYQYKADSIELIVLRNKRSDIFITPGGVRKRSGSVGLSLVMWAACGLLSILGINSNIYLFEYVI